MENEKRMNSYKKASETDSKIWSEDLNGRTTKKSIKFRQTRKYM